MAEKESITFTMHKNLKDDFLKAVEDNQMKMSYVLRQLMLRFIENPAILVDTKNESITRLEFEIQKLQENQQQFITDFQHQIEGLLTQYESQQKSDDITLEESLQDEILGILKTDREVRKQGYHTTEKALLEKYPKLKTRVLEEKQKAKNPVADAIDQLRDEGIAIYHQSNRKLGWKDIYDTTYS
ncbi:MAG: hypothetical protein ACFE9L_11940 [Candidatus Hodarchaeota archaeon]